MNDTHVLIETEARHQIHERVSRAASPRLPREPSAAPHGPAAAGFADRIDG